MISESPTPCNDLGCPSENLIALQELTAVLNDRDEILIKERDELKILNHIMEGANRSTTSRELFDHSITYLVQEFNFSGGIAFLVNPKRNVAKINYSLNTRDVILEKYKEVNLDKSPYNKIFKDGDPIIVRDAQKRFSHALGDKVQSIVGYPITSPCGIIGCILLFSHEFKDPNERALSILPSIMGYLGDALRRIWAERNLAESEKWFKFIFEQQQNAIFIIDAESHVILDANEEAVNLIGSPKEEILNKVCHSFICPTEPGKCPITDLNLEVDKNERILIDHQGNSIPVLKTAKRTKIGKKDVIVESFIDISDQKEAQRLLLESKEKYKGLYKLLRSMCDNVPDMIWAKDLSGKYVFSNKALCDRLLIAENTDEPIGKSDMFFAQRQRDLHPEDPKWHTFGDICRDTDKITLDNNFPSQFDETGNVQGKFLFLDVHKSPFVDEFGNVIGVVGSARDVTDLKEMMREQDAISLDNAVKNQELMAISESLQVNLDDLHAGLDRIGTIIDSLPIAVAWKDANDIFRGCNKSYLDLLNLNRDQIIGKKYHEVIPLHMREKSLIMSDRARIDGRVRYTDAIYMKSGKKVDAEFYKIIYKDDTGNIAGMVMVIHIPEDV